MTGREGSSGALDFDGLRPPSPFMSAAHDEWRREVRAWVDHVVTPHIDDWDASGTFPDAAYGYLDQCVWRFEQGEAPVADLGMLKIQATSVLEHCARDALQIVGGSACAGSSRLERIYRESRTFAIGGGTEEVLRDLAARQLGF
jgi:alkylation response protein AidB-like acyl-CoA dehydrogenase